MGKKKDKILRSSMKVIREAIANFNPVAPICIHESRTLSFRDHLYPSSSFNSVYYSPPPASNSPSPTTSTSYSHNPHRPPDSGGGDSSFSSSLGQSTDKVENFLVHPTTTTTTNSSSSLVNSKRFFFSPSITKSIMEEGKLYLGHRKIKSFDDLPNHPEPPETLAGTAAVGDVAAACFCEESILAVMSSDDPYRDFRLSMEEMMDFHEMKEWSELQKLLHCYLGINDKRTHKFIMLAFVDLLMQFLSSKDHLHNSNNSSTPPYSSPAFI